MRSSKFLSSKEPSGRYLRIVIGIFLLYTSSIAISWALDLFVGGMFELRLICKVLMPIIRVSSYFVRNGVVLNCF